MKNCKIKGAFGELNLMTDSIVEADFETLVEKKIDWKNHVAKIDLTGFTINKENQGLNNQF